MKTDIITVKELQKILNEKKPVFILDVRTMDQRKEWHIPESVHKDVYKALKDGDPSILDDIAIPENIAVVTVCEEGKTSKIARDILIKRGYPAYSLEGGMKAWNYAWNIALKELPDSDIKIIQVRRAAKGCISYIVGSGNEAIVVDASLDPEVYSHIAREHHWNIRYVMDTHIHADYISRTRELAAKTGAEHLFSEKAQVEYSFSPLSDSQVLPFGNTKLKVLHTPGHTPESTCYLIDGRALLTGDTLFTDGVGRPDLKADKQQAVSNAANLFDSLLRLFDLPEDTLLLPAHISHPVPFNGAMIQASLAELKNKLDLLSLSKKQFIAATLERIPPTPPNYLKIATLNKKGSFDGYDPAQLEAGANRCAIT
jgi:glyoxylase-like metal-dependent hydrolase (beta-lactamase superfamily II)